MEKVLCFDSSSHNKNRTLKRDFLRQIEIQIQSKWDADHLFKVDADENSNQEKYYATCTLPRVLDVMNLAQALSITKTDFNANYQRMKGKKVLFPIGFDCSGGSVSRDAYSLTRELETYGNPPQFPEDEIPQEEEEEISQNNNPLPYNFRRKKMKIRVFRTWRALKLKGIPESEIPKFTNPNYWTQYYLPLAINSCKKLGVSVDWRRQFITSDVNPYFDSFVKWQLELLKDRDKIGYQHGYIIAHPDTGRHCNGHDRQTGESIEHAKEFLALKMELPKPFPEKLKPLEERGKRVYLLAALGRPETVYGVTNLWIHPDADYVAFEANDESVFICTARAALSMIFKSGFNWVDLAFQGITHQWKTYTSLAELKGKDFVGIPLKHPFSLFYETIYVLPSLTLPINTATSIFVSTPADNPEDYLQLQKLKLDEKWRDRLGVAEDTVSKYSLPPVICVPEFGDKISLEMCERFRIRSPLEKAKLSDAVRESQLIAREKGIMLAGSFQGYKVKEALPMIRMELLDSKEAIIYAEPAELVMTYQGECVAALRSLWFLDYAEARWQFSVENHLKKGMQFHDTTLVHQLCNALRIHQRCFNREEILGCRVPWDSKQVVEAPLEASLFPAFCTISHLLQPTEHQQKGSNDNNGTIEGIKPELMTRRVWDYVFLNGEYPLCCGIPLQVLEKLRKEFEYWYPIDFHSCGKEHINSFLMHMLYNHAAVWQDDKWPKSFRCHGNFIFDSIRMIRNSPQFRTLDEAIDTWGCDAVRFTLASSGDSLEDCNFVPNTADAIVQKLYTQIEWVEEMIANKDKLRDGPPISFGDRVFDSLINKAIIETDNNYQRTAFYDVLKTGFHDLQSSRDWYRSYCCHEPMNRGLVFRFIEVQALLMAPIIPHWSEHVWGMLGKTASIRRASWPSPGELDHLVLHQQEYLQDLLRSLRSRKDAFEKKIPRNNHKIKSKLPLKGNEVGKVLSKDLACKPFLNRIMPFLMDSMQLEVQERGIEALELRMPFDEKALLEENADYIKRSLELQVIEIRDADSRVAEKCTPGHPFSSYSHM